MVNNSGSNSNSKKTVKSIGARVTEDQYNQIIASAKAEGLTVSDWILQKIGKNEDYVEIKRKHIAFILNIRSSILKLNIHASSLLDEINREDIF